MKLIIWKIWFKITRKIVCSKFLRSRNVINHANYSPLVNKVWNYFLKKNEYAWARYMDLWSPCNYSRADFLIEMRNL